MKHTIKKLCCLAIAMLTLISGTACSTAGSGSGEAAESTGAAITVGIIQLIENGAFTDMREGFSDRLTEGLTTALHETGHTETEISIDYKNAQGDMGNLNAICQEMIDKKVDLIVTIGTPATQAIVNMESDIPVVFISLSDPVKAGVISRMETPDKNATGTSNAIPIEQIFELADTLTPGRITYGLLYSTSEVNSVSTINEAKAYLEANGLSYRESVVTNSSEIQQAAQLLVEEVDAIFVPNDSMIQSAMDLVAEVAKDAGIPLYGSSAVMVDSGAFATVAISDREIGAISADMAIQVLTGTPIEEIPAIVVPANDIVINRTTAEALDVTIPESLEAGNVTFVG